MAAYAVSAYFGTRNPEHELETKDLIRQLTTMPVVCSHELSQELGAYERPVTAFLNAQLIPITTTFVDYVASDIKRRGIEARILILRCDGSVSNIEDTLNKPIETIFSGPAASLLGASFLASKDTCAVIDVGGTSTDLSSIYNGVPGISESGGHCGWVENESESHKDGNLGNGWGQPCVGKGEEGVHRPQKSRALVRCSHCSTLVSLKSSSIIR